jgi:hypothetical protein
VGRSFDERRLGGAAHRDGVETVTVAVTLYSLEADRRWERGWARGRSRRRRGRKKGERRRGGAHFNATGVGGVPALGATQRAGKGGPGALSVWIEGGGR